MIIKKISIVLIIFLDLVLINSCNTNKYSDENIKKIFFSNKKLFNKIADDFVNKNEIIEYCVFSNAIPDDLKSDLEKLNVQCVDKGKSNKNSAPYIKFTLFGLVDSECGIIYYTGIFDGEEFDILNVIEEDWYIYRDD